MRLSALLAALAATMCLAATIEIGSASVPSNTPYCGD